MSRRKKKSTKPLKVLFAFGTRPEAIKLLPLIQTFLRKPTNFEVYTCVAAQHREMLDQVLDVFEITPDYDLNIMTHAQSLVDITAAIITKADKVIQTVRPDYIFVQGDTTTTFAVSLVAFYNRIKLVHIEAGLRTWDKYAPFPEEINRKLTSSLADLHFAPTEKSRNNLLNEGVSTDQIVVTGNTVIDALLWVQNKLRKIDKSQFHELNGIDFKKKIILVTGHRRESFGEGFVNICNALRDIASQKKDIEIVYPVHLNPNVRKHVFELIGDVSNIKLLEPLAYLPFAYLMKQSFLILTDSGGIQEEAPALGKPVLVMRDITERPEAIEAGTALLVGSKKEMIVEQTLNLIKNRRQYERMSSASNPYGAGNACELILNYFLKVIE